MRCTAPRKACTRGARCSRDDFYPFSKKLAAQNAHRPGCRCFVAVRSHFKMSGESSLAFIRNIYARSHVLTKDFSKGTASAALVILSLLGVCGVLGVLTFIKRGSTDDVANEVPTTAVNAASAVPVAPLRNGPTPPQAEPLHPHVHPKHSASLSEDKLEDVIRKRGKKRSAAKKSSSVSMFPRRTVVAAGGVTDGEVAVGKNNGTTELEKDALVFVQDEDYDRGATDSTMSVDNDKHSEQDLEKSPRKRMRVPDAGTSSSSPSEVLLSRRSTRTTPGRSTMAISTAMPTALTMDVLLTRKQMPSFTNSSAVYLERRTDVLGPIAGDNAGVGAVVEVKSRSSPSLLFCFYDDRSTIRSPGFSLHDFPVQLCTDVAFCCVDVSAKGHVVVSKNLKLFLQVLGHEFLPASHLYLTLGGHRVLVHHLDAALQNTARFATELSEEVKRLGVGGLAVYLEDVELLKHAFRVHDLIMAVRGVPVAVVLPRDLRQQVRYYHTEIYANTKDMLVISPPSQGYGGMQPRPAFATCPHPRRSVHEGSSLEFIYQLSRTLLSSVADGAVGYVSTNVGAVEEKLQPPRYVIGVSFGGLKFQLKNRSLHDVGSPATFVRVVPYREICKRPWRHWHDNVSECFVAWDGDHGWMSSLGPGSVGFATELAKGLAVFDLDYDDHSGECGNKFPVLRALHAALLSERPKNLK
ncbi:hypothetical protein HPB49_020224 [Dermacentor silvarum]|uniref:Uncharacterized protein n=1 Tax=Dermacentor silvarum TaxID=543639 RepID=A0ACB8DFQ8_DERSI|nr:hypothetical protein HPB49_020224 [Dermacentor silvarum]